MIGQAGLGALTTYDNSNSTIANWMEIGNEGNTATGVLTGGVEVNAFRDTITHFNEFLNDKLYIKVGTALSMQDLGLTATAATSTTSGQSVDNGTYTTTYSAVNTGTVASPVYKLATLNVDAGAVLNGAAAGSGATAYVGVAANTTAGKGDFVFDNNSADATYGNLYWNSAGGANPTFATMVEVAHIDMNTALAANLGPLNTLSNSDFILTL